LTIGLFDFPWYGMLLGIFFSTIPLAFIKIYSNKEKDKEDAKKDSALETPLLELKKATD